MRAHNQLAILYLQANGKGDSPEVEIVLTRHLQLHAAPF